MLGWFYQNNDVSPNNVEIDIDPEGCFLNKVYIKDLFKVFNKNLNFWASGNINLKEVFNKNLNWKRGCFLNKVFIINLKEVFIINLSELRFILKTLTPI